MNASHRTAPGWWAWARRYINARLARQLMMAVLPVSVIFIVALALLAFRLGRAAIVAQVEAHNRQIAAQMGQEVLTFFHTTLDILRLEETALAAQKTPQVQAQALLHLRETFPYTFDTLRLYDADGRPLMELRGALPDARARGVTMPPAATLPSPITGTVASVSPVNFRPLSNAPYVTLTAPLSQTVILVAELDLRSFWAKVDSLRIENGSVSLVDEDGTILAHPDRQRVGQRLDYAAIAPVFSGYEGVATYRYNGVKYLAAYSPVGQPINWGVIVEQSEEAALAPVRVLGLVALLVTLLSTGTVMAVLSTSVRRVVEPLEALSRTASRIAASGDLDIELEGLSDRHDEVGLLNVSLAQMLKALRKAHLGLQQLNEDLEQRVQERTAELEKAKTEAEAARAQAEQANQMKSAFLASMSHELRTPLNAIIGYSEMLQEEAEDAAYNGMIPDLQKICAAGQQLLGLINDILDLSKIEAGKMVLYQEEFPICELLQQVVATIQPVVEQKQNVLHFEADADLGLMRADATRVRQVLLNLLSNAAKFTENGHITLCAFRETRDAAHWVQFTVSDTGIGIPADKQAQIFEDFVQAEAHTTRKYGGTGLGLSISRRLCRLMGGDITLVSDADCGATFTVRLPVGMQTASAAAATADELPLERPLRVLAIDDDPAARELIGRHLARESQMFEVTTAASGAEGLRLARSLRPDVITLDVLMPDMDGWTVLAKLKEDPLLSDIPVIILTLIDDQARGFALNAADYLTKPIDHGRLIRALRRHRPSAGESEQPAPAVILVVEDNLASRILHRRMLEQGGWQVIEAANGKEGLEKLAHQQANVILLDLFMPQMNGFEFVEHLRAHPEWREIPVIVITTKDITPEESRRLNGYIQQILQKGSYHPETLLAEVRQLMMEKRKKGHV